MGTFIIARANSRIGFTLSKQNMFTVRNYLKVQNLENYSFLDFRRNLETKKNILIEK